MKGIRIAFAAVALMVMTAPHLPAQSRGLGSLNGTIISDEGQPVAEASIKVQFMGGSSLESKSDASGKWNLIGIGKGEFLVDVQKDGFAAKRLKIVVERETMRTEPIKVELKKG